MCRFAGVMRVRFMLKHGHDVYMPPQVHAWIASFLSPGFSCREIRMFQSVGDVTEERPPIHHFHKVPLHFSTLHLTHIHHKLQLRATLFTSRSFR
jgi:hypothetical protein